MSRRLWLAAAFGVILSAGVGNSASSQSPAPAAPAPFPSAMATRLPVFTPDYIYLARPNDPRVHPVPAEMQTQIKRDAHIYCYDWERRRPNTADKFTYFITTCECFSQSMIDLMPKH
jgi:hypothetical protein